MSSAALIAGARWRVPGADGFLWHDLGGIHALFNPRSGDTHLIDMFSRELLDTMAAQPATVDELAALFGTRLDLDPEGGLRERIVDTFVEFDRLGLIFPLAPNH